MIQTADTYIGRPVDDAHRVIRDCQTQQAVIIPLDRLAEHAAVSHWSRPDVDWHIPTTLAPIGLPAFVSGGRWLVQCPACLSAQYACEQDARFFCVDCLNEHAGGAWVRVVWPKEREAIEAALLERPDKHSQTWMPHESVDDLRRQNAEHGI